MATKVNIPDFDFSGFYYGEILDALIEYKRANVPEISNESPYELGIQLLRAYALVGHLNNVLLDMQANESMISTASTREAVVGMLALIGYLPTANIPSRGAIRAQLTQTFTTTTPVVPDNALFGTRLRGTTPAILFEADNAITVDRTDVLSGAYDFVPAGTAGGPLWVKETSNVNGASIATFLRGKNNTGVMGGPDDGSMFFLGHTQALTNRITFETFTTLADFGNDRPGAERVGVWEYFDGDLTLTPPDDVAISGATLKFGVNKALGQTATTAAPRPGGWFRVTYLPTNTVGWARVTWTGVKNEVVISSYLGQVTPSTSPGDYLVGSYWREIPNVTDTTQATIPVSGETLTTATGVSSYPGLVLDGWPVNQSDLISLNWTSSGSPDSGTFSPTTGAVTGNVSSATAYNNTTGTLDLVLATVADAATSITADYSRASHPFRQDGEIQFVVPMTATEDWHSTDLRDAFPTEVESIGSPPVTTQFWIRYRLAQRGGGAPSVGALNKPIGVDRVRWDQGDLYLRIEATQGRTYKNQILGSGDGSASQSFTLSKSPVIEGSLKIEIDGSPWTQVESFLNADALDEVYIVTVDSDGVATAAFGDGINGKVVPAGTANVIAEVRIGAGEDGNVGANDIVLNRSGLSRVSNVTNPRSFIGWQIQEGQGSELALEKLKRDGVGSLRALNRAVTTSDYNHLAEKWVDTGYTETAPYLRSETIPEGYGPKTIRGILVPDTGVSTATSALLRLESYFNGDATTDGVGMINTVYSAEHYQPVTFPVEVHIVGGDAGKVTSGLYAMLRYDSVADDGVNYRWEFGSAITPSKINALVFKADPTVESCIVIAPASTVQLDVNELPWLQPGDILVTS